MQSSQTPTLIPLPFASGGGRNTIPEASQLPGNPGGASLTDGFPPATRTPIVAGGIPPSGLDMNGILFLLSAPIRWQQAGGLYAFSSSFAADTNVGGYPAGAELMSADLQGTWISLNDNNTDNPDTGAGTKWIPGRAYGVTALAGLSNANVTLTPAQAAKNKITLAGTLTGNIQIILPTWTRDWTVVNNTSGAFTITVKTAAGTGVVLAAGQQKVTGDGTNIIQATESIAAATIATQAAQLGQVQSGASTFGVDTGTANTYQVAFSPAVTALSDGLRLRFRAKTANTGASTFAANSTPACPIWGANHSPLQGGEIIVNGEIEVVFGALLNGGNGAWVLLENTGGPIQGAPATQSMQLAQYRQAAGNILAIRRFTSSGTYTPTAGTVAVRVQLVGGGGGGGGSSATSTGQQSVGAGGAGGSYAESFLTSGFSGVTMTIGAAGSAGAIAGSGGNGGTTSFGALLSATGGGGGQPSGAAGTPFVLLGGAPGTMPTSGNVLNAQGAPGGNGAGPSPSSTTSYISGAGGASMFGGAPNGLGSANAPGVAGQSYGSGGSGGASGASAAGQLGGAGAIGAIIITEYGNIQ